MNTKLAFLFVTLAWLILNNPTTEATRTLLSKDIVSRLEGASGEGGLADCWGALVQLKSCTNEIVLFFLNGDTNLGPGCCRAIGFITRSCWPTMLTSIGFTTEEGDILRGYCDAASPEITTAPSPAPIAYPPLASV
ncbi:hypothetical protein UlMin_038018 [Ulmus minor]